MRFARAQALAGALTLLLCAASPAASGEPARVVLVRPGAADPSISEALIRIRGELVADGFDVEVLDAAQSAASAPRPTMDDAGQQAGSAALIGLFLAPDGQAAELWVVDPRTHETLVRRIDTRGEAREHIVEVLAVRAVELLRASLLELLMSSQRAAAPAPAAAPPPSEVSQQAPRQADRSLDPPRRSMWGVELGGGLLASPGGVGPALLLVARLRFAPLGPIGPLEARLSFAGLGTAPRVAGPQGSATVQQRFGLVELAALPWPELRLRPRFSVGLGALHVAVDGEASWPYRGVHSGRWAFAADAGAGVELGIVRRLDVVVEAHALVAHPYPVVRFVETEAARGARPALLGSLSLVGWL
ncbi:hypothetical protein [Sorangium sp. So ce204]|uniref:hypothetical protein n=1 Tax=Sorangium sp. So ce204 TaxID=3133288 RepID=UPI003F62CFD5